MFIKHYLRAAIVSEVWARNYTINDFSKHAIQKASIYCHKHLPDIDSILPIDTFARDLWSKGYYKLILQVNGKLGLVLAANPVRKDKLTKAGRFLHGKHTKDLIEYGSQFPMFAPLDASKALGIDRRNASAICCNLVKSGVLNRVERGVYTVRKIV